MSDARRQSRKHPLRGVLRGAASGHQPDDSELAELDLGDELTQLVGGVCIELERVGRGAGLESRAKARGAAEELADQLIAKIPRGSRHHIEPDDDDLDGDSAAAGDIVAERRAGIVRGGGRPRRSPRMTASWAEPL